MYVNSTDLNVKRRVSHRYARAAVFEEFGGKAFAWLQWDDFTDRRPDQAPKPAPESS